ncbi:5'-nucleotidase C-terminal domain-containing protein [Brevibacillus porteri]|uniref:Bifunctional metallophosphatase/5'-nucleotidase n=2 Tax=Brevibacillus TaxID=55080 RepID=A0ABX5FU85_9BACL|nr:MULTISPECIES: 5'-nucleotidase C-terminal domain-containing protein [Brevibacillus]MDC0761379.1 5'-nucleotidase C-terminal domain-containing protein [Brevibacillus sp. AG]MED1799739.1 5'-nucleotidase C-terminal domain-containing protein [Brevibacillus porteri]MED2131072.1 5'-nucleotidase C-terminal domain-containing protein [Brevibacillus porteri]MED2747083.1 5'-nucleotidase C-terminal domain-containing protein [Brevibacillus porteri]MED2816521.1 5'-nucleotidase C-terminal domain-containing 
MKKLAKGLLSVALTTMVLGSAMMGIAAPVKAAETPTKITLLGTSDIHGRFMPWDYALDGPNQNGSMTQLFTMIKEIRKENPNTVLLDAGDSIQDNSAELFNDQPQSPIMVAMNEMNYDAWAFGNHEFNFGLDVLDKVSSQYKGSVLAGNIYKENGERFLPAYTIIERAGVKIGIIGMNTPMITDFEKGTDHLDGLVIKNPVEETKKAVKELEGKVDVMIGLMHMGIENENGIPGTGVADIANAVPELTAIFAGHMHKLVKKEEINGVLISEPDKYATHISRIDLTFEKKDGKLVLTDKEATALPVKGADGTPAVSDAELETKLKPFHEFARADANIVVAELKGMNLVPKNEIEGIPTVQIQETPLSDFFHEVMLYYSKADVVAHQIDNDKAKLDVGPIKKKDIAYNYQYAGGEITVYKVTGKDLKDYMEWAVGYFNSTRPGDVTVSFDPKRRASKYSTNDFFGGVKYEIDLTKPYGSRITNLRKLDETPIKAEDTLKLGMNSYRMEALQAKGGALEGRKFEQLWSSKDNTAFGETGGTIRNRAIAYLKEVKKGVYEPKVQNNWKITGMDTTAPERKDVVELINAGILSVPKTADGKYTNIASINIKDAVTKEEIAELSAKVKVDAAKFATVKTKGEFYHQLNEARKAAEKSVTPPTKTQQKK